MKTLSTRLQNSVKQRERPLSRKNNIFVEIRQSTMKPNACEFNDPVCSFKTKQFPASMFIEAEYFNKILCWVDQHVLTQASQLPVNSKFPAPIIVLRAG